MCETLFLFELCGWYRPELSLHARLRIRPQNLGTDVDEVAGKEISSGTPIQESDVMKGSHDPDDGTHSPYVYSHIPYHRSPGLGVLFIACFCHVTALMGTVH